MKKIYISLCVRTIYFLTITKYLALPPDKMFTFQAEVVYFSLTLFFHYHHRKITCTFFFHSIFFWRVFMNEERKSRHEKFAVCLFVYVCACKMFQKIREKKKCEKEENSQCLLLKGLRNMSEV